MKRYGIDVRRRRRRAGATVRTERSAMAARDGARVTSLRPSCPSAAGRTGRAGGARREGRCRVGARRCNSDGRQGGWPDEVGRGASERRVSGQRAPDRSHRVGMRRRGTLYSLSYWKRIAVPSRVMRSHTARFSSSLRNTQFDTSAAVRPQPLQTSSKSVEHTPMQGLSGRS